MAQPCSITHAFAVIDTVRSTIRLLPGNYVASLVIDGKTVTVDGFGAMLTAASAGRALEIQNGAHVRLFGLSIVDLNLGDPGIALGCETTSGSLGPIVELDQVSLDSAKPLFAYPCSLTITRSHFHGRDPMQSVLLAFPPTTASIDRTVFDGGDGVQALGANSIIHITNSVIANQTGPDGAFSGNSLFGTGPIGAMYVSFSTVINSKVTCGTGTPVCASGTIAGACIDNSIIYSAGAATDTVTGSACLTNFSLVFPQSTPLTGSNNKLGMNPSFVNAPSGDYHLMVASPAIDAADPAAALTLDLEGTARPQGAHDDMGAFEYKP